MIGMPENGIASREKGIDARCMDGYELDFPDAMFDAVWSDLPKQDLDQVLAEIRRVMKPNRLFYLGMWGGMDFEGV